MLDVLQDPLLARRRCPLKLYPQHHPIVNSREAEVEGLSVNGGIIGIANIGNIGADGQQVVGEEDDTEAGEGAPAVASWLVGLHQLAGDGLSVVLIGAVGD